MQRHCKTVHGWVNQRTRGGNVRHKATLTYDQPWESGILCQRFFASRAGSSWFQVRGWADNEQDSDPDLPPPNEDADEDPGATQSTFSTLAHRTSKTLTYGSTEVHNSEGNVEPNPWLRRTGFAAHLAGLDTDVLRRTVSLEILEGWDLVDWDLLENRFEGPEQAQGLLQRIWDSMGRVVRRAMVACSYDNIGHATCFEIYRKDRDVAPRMPFKAGMEEGTIRDYTSVWKRVLGFILRTIDAEDAQRPPYKLTKAQRRSLRELIQAADTPDDNGESPDAQDQALDECLCNFLVTLLDHPLPGPHVQSVLLSALAVMGVRPDGGWVGPIDYTRTLAAVIKVARLVVVWQAVLELRDQDHLPGNDCEDESDEPLDLEKPALFPLVRARVERFMVRVHTDTLPHPLDWVYTTMAYGKKIRHSTPAQGTVSWDGDKITHHHSSFTMRGLTEMLHTLVRNLGTAMDDLTYAKLATKKNPKPTIDWTQLTDNPALDIVGQSFLDDPRNVWMRSGSDWILNTVQQNTLEMTAWAVRLGPDETKLNPDQVRQYLDRVNRFREGLLVAMHFLGGQPARANEFLNLRHVNTPSGGLRNILIEDGIVGLYFTYHKGYSGTGNTKVVYRYLPRELGDLLVRYLWLVLPFCQTIESELTGNTQLSPFLWDKSFVFKPSEASSDNVRARLWSSDKMRRIIQDTTYRYLQGTKLNISTWRHMAIAVARKYLGDGKALDDSDIFDDSDSEAEDFVNWTNKGGDRAVDLQAGHSTHIAHMTYGRDVTQGRLGLAFQQQQYRRVSVLWHKLLTFQSYDPPPPGLEKPAKVSDKMHGERRQRLKQLSQMDLDGRLRSMLGQPDAKLRMTQRLALDHLVRGVSPILQVAGTGGGKSLTFMLPAHCQPQATTVVIVPFIALQEDIAQRCRTMSISCDIWSPSKASSASLILVTPESFVLDSFRDFLNRLVEQFRLDRIVFDECHTVLDATYEFRPQLRTIGSFMNSIGTQLVFLTATMPPRDEPEFWDLLHVNGSKAFVVRRGTTRRNISYRVAQAESAADLRKQVVELVRGVVGDPSPSDKLPRPRVIVYVLAIFTVSATAAELGCDIYHGKLDKLKRSDIVQRWLKNGGPIVATCALGAGVDIPDVRLVVHYHPPRTLRDFVQESGRAGRDGEPSTSVIVHTRRPTQQRALGEPMPDGYKEDIADLLSDDVGCRRTIIDCVMDGNDERVRCQPGEQPCDLCLDKVAVPASPETAAAERAIDFAVEEEGRFQQESYELAEQLRKYLVLCSTQECFVCLGAQAPGIYSPHPLCSSKNPRPIQGELTTSELWEDIHTGYKTVQKAVKSLGGWAKHSGCSICYVPQKFCDRWEAYPDDEGNFSKVPGAVCQYMNLVFKVISFTLQFRVAGVDTDTCLRRALEIARTRGAAVDDFLAGWDTEADVFAKFFRTRVKLADLETNGFCILFLSLCSTAFG